MDDVSRAFQDIYRRLANLQKGSSGSATSGSSSGGGSAPAFATYCDVLTTWDLDKAVTVSSDETWACTSVNLGSSGALSLDGELLLIG